MRRRRIAYDYGVDDQVSSNQQEDPLDIDSVGFKVDLYLEKLLKELSLTELFDKERQMKRETQQLDSNMQYLVYENHSKFITASETIKEMKDDFQHLEDDMGHLSSKMSEIRDSSDGINQALSDRKQQITKLSSVHHLLKKLQFLFELPTRLKTCIQMESYAQAVKYYVKAQKVLEQYQHLPSFHGIQQDCAVIITQLKAILKQRLDDQQSKPKVIAESVDLLLELQEPPEHLCDQFLMNSQRQLEKELEKVEAAAKESITTDNTEPQDVIMDAVEFVGVVSSFLGNLSLVIQSCFDMFINRIQMSGDTTVSQQALIIFVQKLMNQCMQLVKQKFLLEAKLLDSGILARALDRLLGKLQTMNQLVPAAEINRKGQDLVTQVVQAHTQSHALFLQQKFSDSITDVRQGIATFKGSSPLSTPPLKEYCSAIYTAIRNGLDSSIINLQEFIGPNVSFSSRSEFRSEFCMTLVREEVVVNLLETVIATCKEFSQSSGGSSINYPPTLVLTLSSLIHDLERSHISYLISNADEKFPPYEVGPIPPTPIDPLVTEAKSTAEMLINHYVRVQGGVLSQMIRKSVETRDWLTTMEPRNVRSVMKRLVEEVASIDKQVGLLYEEGVKKTEGSETSRTFTYSLTRGGRGGYPYSSRSGMDSSFLSNIQKLFHERIEVFGSVEFNKLSIVTGIIKIALKALVECVRLRTFGKFGLQQMQVDAHYLQVYLWKYVTDEQLVPVLLDEVLNSTKDRCIDPVLMEQSVVELICEKT